MSEMKAVNDLARQEWEKERVVVEVWDCGDEVCDCCQAHVDRITPNRKVGYPWIHRERLATGEFYTDGEGWRDDQVYADAEALAKQFGLEYARA